MATPNEFIHKRVAANLAPLYLASFLEKHGVPVEIRIKDRLEDLEDFQPDVLGVSSVTENIETAKKLARKAKEKWNSLTILGGVHITALPQSLPGEFDLGVVGEGEETLKEVLEGWNQSHGFDLTGLNKIKGLVYHQKKGLHFTGFRPGLECLDEIPVPKRELFIKNSPITYMMTSRGCPYTCHFCVIPKTSKGYRVHSPEYVVEEIKSIVTHYPEVKNIRIFDDLYIVHRERVEEIADRIVAEGLHQELSFGCWGRANLIDEALVDTFQKMNMVHVAFGAESGSSRVLSKIKPGVTLEENQRALEMLDDHGIRVACSVILGHPEESEADLMATHDFLAKNMDRLFDVEFNVAIPWPGTDLWDFAKDKGWV
ncbi:MAG: radical SAM protein, partial [bacterium]|nr:radical SAM protein [bacterium]